MSVVGADDLLGIARKAGAIDYYVVMIRKRIDAETMDAPFAGMPQKGENVAAGCEKIVDPAPAAQDHERPPARCTCFTSSGTLYMKRIHYWAYPGEVPVFDFTNMVISTTGYTHGFVVSGSWLHFKGLRSPTSPTNTLSNNGVDA